MSQNTDTRPPEKVAPRANIPFDGGTGETFTLALREALASRPPVATDPPFVQSPGTSLPMPEGATFSTGEPIRGAFCFSLPCEWFTRARIENEAEYNGIESTPVAFTENKAGGVVMVILPEAERDAEAAYAALLAEVQTKPGFYAPNGFEGLMPPSTAWGVKPRT